MSQAMLYLMFQLLALGKDAYFQEKRLAGKTEDEIKQLWEDGKDEFNEENPDLPDV